MRYYTSSFNIDRPTTALFQPALIRRQPSIVEIGDPWGRYGSGIGLGSMAAFSGMGEFYERRHFFTEVPSHRLGLLQETLSKKECSTFLKAFEQTLTPSVDSDSLNTHLFRKTRVKRLKDFSECEIPTVCLSISPAGLHMDNYIFPVRDTCGCSFHWNLEKAIFGALRESIERQFLLRYWLTGISTKKLDISEYSAHLNHSNSSSLLHALKSEGELTALDITDSRFPGRCVIVVYGKNDVLSSVQYCTGMAYSHTTESALEKAVYELWQTFRYIRNFCFSDAIPKDIKDPYLRHFLSCNSYSTYLEMTNSTSSSLENSAPSTTPLTLTTLKAAISDTNIDGYLYITPTKISKNPHFFCKYISPHSFMHMNNSANLNLKNSYSQSFLHMIIKSHLSTMVPFP